MQQQADVFYLFIYFCMHLCKSCGHESITASRYRRNSIPHQHFIVYYRWMKASLSLWEYNNKASILQLNNALPSRVLSDAWKTTVILLTINQVLFLLLSLSCFSLSITIKPSSLCHLWPPTIHLFLKSSELIT